MSEPVIRSVEAGDLPALRSLWASVFGDPENLIDEFFRLLPDMGGGLCAVADGTPVGCAYLLTGQAFEQPGQTRETIGYLYAVAVDPAYRGRGLGAALSQAAFTLGEEQGRRILCTQPADAGLFSWYGQRLGTVCALRRRVETVPAGETQPYMELSPTEYRLWREQLLRAKPHVFLGDAALRWQHSLCRCCGGGFFLIGDGVAAAYKDGDALLVKELLCAEAAVRNAEAENRLALAASLAASLGAKNAVLCTADPAGEPYIAALPGMLPEDAVWDLSFD